MIGRLLDYDVARLGVHHRVIEGSDMDPAVLVTWCLALIEWSEGRPPVAKPEAGEGKSVQVIIQSGDRDAVEERQAAGLAA